MHRRYGVHCTSMAWDRRIVRRVAYRRLVGIGVMTILASACSLFVSLDDLQSGDASDASTGDVAMAKDAAANKTDATNVNDAGTDGTAPHTIAFVQATGDHYSDRDGGLPFAAPITAGNALIVVVDNPAPGAVTVTDSESDVFQTFFGP